MNIKEEFVICVVIGFVLSVLIYKFNIIFISLIAFLFLVGVGIFLLIGKDRFLEFRTAKINEKTYKGFVHAKGKDVDIKKHKNRDKLMREYIMRIRTEIGFYDVYDREAYFVYDKGDSINILIKTRYNKKNKPIKEEVTVLGLLAPKYD